MVCAWPLWFTFVLVEVTHVPCLLSLSQSIPCCECFSILPCGEAVAALGIGLALSWQMALNPGVESLTQKVRIRSL